MRYYIYIRCYIYGASIYIRCYIYSASISICAFIYMQGLLFTCTAKKSTCFLLRYYPKATGYVHVAIKAVLRLYSGSIQALFRRYSGFIQARLRRYYICMSYSGFMQALLRRYYIHYLYICVKLDRFFMLD